MAELGLPDEDEFGAIPEDNPSNLVLVPAVQPERKKPVAFEIEIQEEVSEDMGNKMEMKSEDSRF